MELIAGMLPKETEILTGVTTSEQFRDRVQVTVIRIKYDQPVQPRVREEKEWRGGVQSAPAKRSESPAESNGPLEQGVFELQSFDKGCFSAVTPTLYKGEDLDIPTYQRREISINKGAVVR